MAARAGVCGGGWFDDARRRYGVMRSRGGSLTRARGGVMDRL